MPRLRKYDRIRFFMHVHDHSHSHHGHDHHAPSRFGRVFALGMLLNVTYVIVEAGAGFWTDSLALLADAGHNLSDIFTCESALSFCNHILQFSPIRNGLRLISSEDLCDLFQVPAPSVPS